MKHMNRKVLMLVVSLLAPASGALVVSIPWVGLILFSVFFFFTSFPSVAVFQLTGLMIIAGAVLGLFGIESTVGQQLLF